MKVIAIIPAREGSKGIVGKNMKLFNGKPLIEWTINAALKAEFVDRVFVSTDSNQIADFSKSFGLDIPFLRPKELATDVSYVIETVIHTIKIFIEYDYVILLQPTSPLRNSNDIDSVIKLSIENDFRSVVAISEAQYLPQLFYQLKEDTNLIPLFENNKCFNRQEFSSYYILNGACYFASRKFLLENKKFISDDTLGYIMPKERSIDIDSYYDWSIAEFLKNNFDQ